MHAAGKRDAVAVAHTDDELFAKESLHQLTKTRVTKAMTKSASKTAPQRQQRSYPALGSARQPSLGAGVGPAVPMRLPDLAVDDNDVQQHVIERRAKEQRDKGRRTQDKQAKRARDDRQERQKQRRLQERSMFGQGSCACLTDDVVLLLPEDRKEASQLQAPGFLAGKNFVTRAFKSRVSSHCSQTPRQTPRHGAPTAPPPPL